MRTITVMLMLVYGATAYAEPVAESLTLPAGKVHEACVVMQAGDTLEYEYTAGQPLAFNLHYHAEGTVMFPVAEHDAAAEDGVFRARERRHYCLMWTNNGAGDSALRLRYTHSPAL